MPRGRRPIEKLLVANRGEIAARIFRTCRKLGIATVAVCSPDDRGALHARTADEVLEIDSYLAPRAIVAAAESAGADAVHPGYGFLAESPELADAVTAAGLVWVGPP
ncbi:MAG: acety-l/propionyl-CoA carboxylase subunit alpha, partial [Thermoleophilia bacterium]|nr:acety-l/propionyl-CoA carboxylase subunit alpha [Thermoleophilia bacterium]